MEKPVHSAPAGQSIMDAGEADLIRAAQAHRSAFAPLYQRYLARVYYYVRARLASDEDAAAPALFKTLDGGKTWTRINYSYSPYIVG